MSKESDEEFLNDLITRNEAARILGITPESLSVGMSRGSIPLSSFRRGGRFTLFSRSEVVDLIRSSRIPPKKPVVDA